MSFSVLVAISAAYPALIGSYEGQVITTDAQLCNVLTTDCSTFTKVPAVTDGIAHPASAATAALDPESRRAFEHLIGHAARETDAVTWTTRTFAQRMRAFLIGGAKLNGTSAADALSAAFISPKCGPGNTGYVGPFLPAIEAVLDNGNLREVWGLMYILTKTHYFTHLMHALLSPSAGGGPPKSTPSDLEKRFGLSASAVSDRWTLVKETAQLNSSALRYAQGVPDFEFEPFHSWVRFDFSSQTHAGVKQWGDARVSKKAGCSTEGLKSDDPSIEPPLSKAELSYQCGSSSSSQSGGGSGSDTAAGTAAAAAKPPCILKWQPGMLCFDLPNASWTLDDGKTVPGLNERAAILGYRSAAAASGTTANMLQLGTLLGFAPDSDEMVLIRLTMAAWMLPTDDHSFYEILLGGETYVPQGYHMVFGLEDLGQLWPLNATLKTSDGSKVFGASDFWKKVGKRLEMPSGKALLARMSKEAQGYLKSLTGV